jgi:plastocyanin
MRSFFVLLSLVVAAGFAGGARADSPTLTGDVGNGDSFTISMHNADGSAVRNLDPGTYTLVVHDHSSIHNFHLFGPGGVDVSTSIGDTGDQTFTVTLVAGTYTFICDAHPTMKGSFTVGGAAATTTTTSTSTTPKHKAKPKPKPKPKKKKKK